MHSRSYGSRGIVTNTTADFSGNFEQDKLYTGPGFQNTE